MAKQEKDKTQDAQLNVQWVTGPQKTNQSRLGARLQNLRGEDGRLVRDNTFTREDKQQVVDNRLTELYEAWEAGEIADDDFMFKMQEVYTTNHAIGANVLYDNRVRVDNRVELYVLFATTTLGHDESDARRHALREIAKQGIEQGGTVAGKGWGGIKTLRDIRKK